MANALNVKIGGDIRELEKALNQATSKIKSAGKSMMSVGKTLTASVTAPLTALGITSLKTAADFETLQQSMNVLNGSVAEGTRNFERLKEFSAGTPFQLQDLAKAQNMLQGFGLSADEAFSSLSMIGDISAISGGSIEGIGVAFGQAAAEGRLMSRDIRQLINQGVPAIKLLAETMGVAESEIFDLASAGEISFETLQKAFRQATSEGGMFANGMKQQSQTLNGLFSTLKDNISIAMAEIGNSLAEAMNLRELVPAMIERIKQVTDWFKSLSTQARTSIINIVRAIATIGPALVAVGATVTALGVTISLLTSPITLVVGAIAGIATAFVYVRDNFEAFKERFSDIGWWRNAIIDMVQFLIEWSPVSLMIKQMNMLIGFFSDAEIPNVFEGVADSLEALKGETKEYETQFGSLKDAFLNTIKDFTGIDLANMFTPVRESVESTTQSVKGLTVSNFSLNDSFSNFQKVAVPAINNVKKSAIEMGQALQSQVSGAVQSFATTLGNALTGDAGAEGFFNNILMIVADFGENLGKALVAAGVAAQAFQMLLANPLAAIAAGAALIATSRIVKNLLASGPATSVNDALITSDGKIVKFNSADDILASKNMDKVIGGGGGGRVEVFGTLKGQDIFISSDRGSKTYGR